jgi:hypothetical protein
MLEVMRERPREERELILGENVEDLHLEFFAAYQILVSAVWTEYNHSQFIASSGGGISSRMISAWR